MAETFTFRDEDGLGLSDVARLDTMVTVVDAMSFDIDLERADGLRESAASRSARRMNAPSRTSSSIRSSSPTSSS